MQSLYDICFKEIKEKVEACGGRTIDYDDVDRLAIEWSKLMIENENTRGLFTFNSPPPPKRRGNIEKIRVVK